MSTVTVFKPAHRLTDRDWDFLEAKIESIFRGLVRKNGEEMFHHSVEVGRILRREKIADDIAIFGGYCHDVLEDTEITKEGLYDLARATFDPLPTCLPDAVRCTTLVSEVSYSEFEETLEKKLRKQTASKRWAEHKDIRVILIKKADIESNKKTANSVSAEFNAEYLEWAQPLYEKLVERLT